jgi:hypothetical protein
MNAFPMVHLLSCPISMPGVDIQTENLMPSAGELSSHDGIVPDSAG